MRVFFSTKGLLLVGLFLVLVTLGIVVSVSQERTETESSAGASTTLFFVPTSSSGTPIQKNIGENAAFDVMINPGNNLPSIVRLEMNFDATKLAAEGTTPFVVNTTAFPQILDQQVSSGKVIVVVSIGSDGTKAIASETKVGTLTLKALAATTTPVSITFGSSSSVLSIAPTDNATDNVLSTTTPAYVRVAAAPTPTPTRTPTPTASPTPAVTKVGLTLLLHGIGKGGDNANPGSTGTTNPTRPQRTVSVEVLNSQNQPVVTKTGTVTFNTTNGNFTGTIDLGTGIATGPYSVKVKGDQYLKALIPGIQTITTGTTNQLPVTALITGDINNDNVLNIQDYNILIGCYSDLTPAVSCTTSQKSAADITDDGAVNAFDYNLFLRELTNIPGSGGVTGTPTIAPTATRTPTPTPTSGSGTVSLSDWPSENNTGYAHTGVTLQPESAFNLTYDPGDGNILITQPGKVIDGLTTNKCIFVKAANVTIKRSLIKGSCAEGTIWANSTNTLIEDVEIDGQRQATGYSGISGDGFTCRRCQIHNVGSSVRAYGDVKIYDSYFYGNSYGGDSHNSAMSMRGDNIEAVHNYMRCDASWNCSGVFQIYAKDTDSKHIDNVKAENNLFYSSTGYCVYGGTTVSTTQPGTASNIRILNNAFMSTTQWPNSVCGDIGAVAGWSSTTNNVWSGNYRFPNKSNIVTP